MVKDIEEWRMTTFPGKKSIKVFVTGSLKVSKCVVV